MIARTPRAWLGALLAVTFVAAQDAPPPSAPPAAEPSTVRGGDEPLLKTVRATAEKVAGIVQAKSSGNIIAVRADEPARVEAAAVRARSILPDDVASARGRAWKDLGLGGGSEPRDLVAAIASDLPGMTFDATGARLLVDPSRLAGDTYQGDADSDPEATVMLATGVAPDEPMAAHYVVHALLDGPTFTRPPTTDAFLARAALSEGSANLGALLFLFSGVGLEAEVLAGTLRPDDALGGRLLPSKLRSQGPVVGHLLEFVYLDGFAQAAALARKTGFSGLGQERASRATTRDVLHVDRPVGATLPIPNPTVPPASGLTAVDQDSLGEQGIITLVSLVTGKDNLGMIAGDGWMGDSLWRFEHGPPSDGATDGLTVWVTNWKSEEDAKDFAYAMERCLQSRFPGENIEEDSQRGGKVLKRADRVYRSDRAGTQVVVRVATPEIDLKMAPPSKKDSAQSRPNRPKK